MASTLARNTLYFSVSRYLLLGLSVIRNLAVARALGPDDYGLWVIAMLVLTYGDQIHLGLRHVGEREIPYINGRTELWDKPQLVSALYAGILILSSGSLVVATGVFLYLGPTEALSRLVMVCGVIVVSDQVSRFYYMVLRARKEFVVVSKIETMFEVLRTVTVSVLALLFALNGAIAALALVSFMTTLFFLIRYRSEDLRPRVHVSSILRLIPVGIPLFLSGLLYIFMLSLDRVAGLFVLTKTELGLLGLASLLAQVPVSAAQSIKDVLYPSLSEAFGQESISPAARDLYRKVLSISAMLLPVLVALITIISEPIIRIILPDYQPSIPLMRILSNGIYFLCLSVLPLGLLMAARETKKYITVQVSNVLMSIGVYVAFYSFVGNIDSLCYAASCSFFLLASLLFAVTKNESGFSSFSSQYRLFLPSIYSMAVVFFLTKVIVLETSAALSETLTQTGLRLVLYALLLLPVFVLLERRMGFRQLMRDVVKIHA